MTRPRISPVRLYRRLEALGSLGLDSSGGVTRLPFSQPHVDTVRLAAQMMREAGLETGVDEFGTLVGRASGAEGRPALLAGSHLDTVPNGGRFDGALGVAAAIESAHALREAGVRLRHDLAVVAFADEEGARFGVGTLSSRLLTGEVSLSRAGTFRDASGHTLSELLRTREHGLPAAEVPRSVRAFVELHVEQGPRLEQKGLLVGAVDHVTGIAATTMTFHGQARHAGTTPMDARADALLGAATFIVALHDLAGATGGRVVATVGRIAAYPGARNVIPGAATVSVEVRSPDEQEQGRVRTAVEQQARKIAEKLHLRVTVEEWDWSPPQTLDPAVRETSLSAMAARGHGRTVLSSWAGHDAAVLARYVPAGMLFVQSTRGISHSPEEHTREESVEAGAEVLLDVLLALDEPDGQTKVLPLAYGQLEQEGSAR